MLTGFGFPPATIKCDKSINQYKVYQTFFFKPAGYIEPHTIERDKIQISIAWQGRGVRTIRTPNLGYINIGFEFKTPENTPYGNEKGDIHIRSYYLTRITGENFTTEFNSIKVGYQ